MHWIARMRCQRASVHPASSLPGHSTLRFPLLTSHPPHTARPRSGFKYITVLDFAASAAEVHRQRAARPARTGLRVVQRSVDEAEWPELDGTPDGGREFGIVLDKVGTTEAWATYRMGVWASWGPGHKLFPHAACGPAGRHGLLADGTGRHRPRRCRRGQRVQPYDHTRRLDLRLSLAARSDLFLRA